MGKYEKSNSGPGERIVAARTPALVAKSLFSAVLIGLMGVSLIRSWGMYIFTPPKKTVDRSTVEKWMRAVRGGDEKAALLLAASIVPDDDPEVPRADYTRLALLNGLGTALFTSPFNHFDFLRWRNALLAAGLARTSRDLKAGWLSQDEIFKIISSGLKISVSTGEEPSCSLESFEKTWNAGTASAPEWFRFYSEVVFQSGAEIMVVSLFDEDSVVVHAVCEIRGSDGAKFVADPIKGLFWKGVSVSDLAADSSRLKGVWSERERGALKRPEYRLPADPMDYRVFERRLGSVFSRFDFPVSFRFGVDPETRIERYFAVFADKNRQERFSYWHFPFSSLESLKAFPGDWLAPKVAMEEFWVNKKGGAASPSADAEMKK
ncbi:MAG: hypothetical protein GXP32_01205 [Kiritimatiellaeota bacterium]|nr:hypothetical protein [Kiritimatiellota bacterium]